MSVLYGLLVSAFMAATGFVALKWAIPRSQQVFTGVLLGGILFRIALVAGALVWVWKFSSLNGIAFTAALLGSYLIFQFVEAIVLQRYTKSMKSVKGA